MSDSRHNKWVALASFATALAGWPISFAVAKPFESRSARGCTAAPELVGLHPDYENRQYPGAAVNLPWVMQFVATASVHSSSAIVSFSDESGVQDSKFYQGLNPNARYKVFIGHMGAHGWTARTRNVHVDITTSCGTSKAGTMAYTYRPNQSVATPYDPVYVPGGDSYSTGEGSPPFVDGGTCHVSPLAWPNLMFAKHVGGQPYMATNVACSGARIADLFRPYRGQLSQLQRLQKLQPDIVTLTIGGNDVNWTGVILRCVALDCVWWGTIASATRTINSLRKQLTDTYRRIRWPLPNTRIVVVGYPRLFPAAQNQTVNCGWLEPQERIDLNLLTQNFDAVAHLAAMDAGVEFVSTLGAFTGHELCTRDSWVIPIFKPGVANAGHPLPDGQQAIADIVQKYIAG